MRCWPDGIASPTKVKDLKGSNKQDSREEFDMILREGLLRRRLSPEPQRSHDYRPAEPRPELGAEREPQRVPQKTSSEAITDARSALLVLCLLVALLVLMKLLIYIGADVPAHRFPSVFSSWLESVIVDTVTSKRLAWNGSEPASVY